MPIYEYYCENCEQVLEALGSISASDKPAKCLKCGREAYRIMPTTFASMSRRKGLRERVPFHHSDTRRASPKKAIAPVKPRAAAARSTNGEKKEKKS